MYFSLNLFKPVFPTIYNNNTQLNFLISDVKFEISLYFKTLLNYKMAVSQTIPQNLKMISEKVLFCYLNTPKATRALKPPRLVAVSKTKPKEMIIEAYRAGHRDFGENYIQELVEKSNDVELLGCCPDINWHFIGNCQTKNAKKLATCPRLAVIETITSIKLANKLQTQFSEREKNEEKEIMVEVMVQVNTSGEENKNGIQPGPDVISTVKHIVENCPNLKFVGLMTIGALGNSLVDAENEEDNPDFIKLIECRRQITSSLELEEKSIELSMGMSNDFLDAIRMGSTNIRVGSSIFGARYYPPETLSGKYKFCD